MKKKRTPWERFVKKKGKQITNVSFVLCWGKKKRKKLTNLFGMGQISDFVQKIARIANALQCHSELSDHKDFHELR